MRGAVTKQVRAILTGLEPGDHKVITLPDTQPSQRVTLQRINGVAANLFGVGNYALEQRRNPSRVVVAFRRGAMVERRNSRDRTPWWLGL